jgi:glycosyltransferase involved in cell wall biosynthesis
VRLRRRRRSGGRIRLAYVHDGKTFGGIETLQVNTLRRLDAAAFDSVIVLADTGPVEQFREILATIDARIITVARDPGPRWRTSPQLVWRLQRELRRERIDVTHIQTRGPGASRLLTIAAWLAAVPARLRTEHTPDGDLGRSARLKLAPFDLMTDAIVCDSKEQRRSYVEDLHRPRSKVVASYCGIDPFPFDPDHDVAAAKEAVGLPAEKTVVGTVGRMHTQKGHRFLLDATAMLRQRRGDDVLVLIVGDGPDEPELREQAVALGITDVVRFAGFQDEPLRFMEAMDIVVMPSLWEGFSISMQEFMALGKPMVVSDHHSFREAIDDGVHGVVVERGNAAALAAGIELLLDDPALRASVAKAAAERARTDFSIDRHVAELSDLYRDLLAGLPADRLHAAASPGATSGHTGA